MRALSLRRLPCRYAVFGIAMAAALAFPPPSAARDREEIIGTDPEFRVVVPQFESLVAGSLGYSVAFALNHEIFRTFNFSIPDRDDARYSERDVCCLRYRAVSVLDLPLPEQSHESARAFARAKGAQVVVWGKAWPYGNEVVVQPFLTLAGPPEGMAHVPPGSDNVVETRQGIMTPVPFDEAGHWSIWEIGVDSEGALGATVRIEAFPSERYELAPIVFDAAKLRLFESFTGMNVYRKKDVNSEVTGTTGPEMDALRHENEWTLIQQPYGWIKLPELDAAETVDYVEGLMHFMRGNWKRARVALQRVTADAGARAQLRRDAALLLMANAYRLDPSCSACSEPLELAESLNPYSLETAKFAVMARLAALAHGGGEEAEEQARAQLERVRSMAPPDDPFVADAEAVLSALVGTHR